MEADDLERLMRTAQPGTTIEIVRITVPLDPSPEPQPHPSSEAVKWTHDDVVEWVREKYGDAGLKPKNWAALLPGVSTCEIERAIADGYVSHYRKPDGRDHGAYMIRPDDMRAYLVGRPARRHRARRAS